MVLINEPERSTRGAKLLGWWLSGIVGAIAFLAIGPGAAHAGIAAPVEVELTQPDGTTISARPFGDEWAHGYETTDGYTIVRGPDGYWYYAASRGPDGLLESTDRRADRAVPREIDRHLRQRPDGDPRPARPDRDGADAGDIEAGPPTGTIGHTGTEHSLAILVEFTDIAARTTPAQWQSLFFGATGSMTDYYDEVSYGQLSLLPAADHSGPNDGVVGWLNLGYPHPDAGLSALADQVIVDAIAAADPFVDFDRYDANGDGYLSPRELHITVIWAGFEQSYGGPEAQCGPSVWAHQSLMVDEPEALDGVVVGYDGYTTFGEWHCKVAPSPEPDHPGHMATLGPVVHEMGHDLDWPDLYDTDFSSAGVGAWSVMGSGMWGSDGGHDGSLPAHPDAFLKTYQGWVAPSEITGDAGSVAVATSATTPDVKQLGPNPNGVDWSFDRHRGVGEYFLVENRQQSGYDAGLPGCGLLVWHIDEGRTPSNRTNADDHRRLVDLEEADGLNHLDLPEDHESANEGDAGDPFPGSAQNLSFDNTTFPGSNTHDGRPSNVTVRVESTACASTMTASLSHGPILCPPDDRFEPNDSRAEATAAEKGDGGDLKACSNDPDYSSIALAAGEQLRVGIVFNHRFGDLDMRLENASGTVVASSHSVTDDETITYTPSSSGTYFVRVVGFNEASNAYRLNFSPCPPDDPFEDNDSRTTARPLTSGQIVDGTRCRADDDYYSIPAYSGELIAADLLFDHDWGDLDLELMDDTGGVLARAGGDSHDEFIRFVAPRTATYVLRVHGFADAENFYRLRVWAITDFIGAFVPAETPFRIFDSRSSSPLGPGEIRQLQVVDPGGASGGPDWDATGVVLNVTATQPSSAGHLTIYPAGSERPLASNLNFTPGLTVANLVTVQIGSAGRINIFNSSGTTDVVVDVAGWFTYALESSAGRLEPVQPYRALDTRSGVALGPGETKDVQITGTGGAGGVPVSGASAVVLNVTATEPSAGGFLTVFPSGAERPLASNLNFSPGGTVPNRVMVRLGTNGRVSIFNPSGTVDVIVDVNGWYTDGSASISDVGLVASIVPFRGLDTRDTATPFGPGETRTVSLLGIGPVPANGVRALLLNVTVTQPTSFSHLTLWPSGTSLPPVSDLNYGPDQTVPNLVLGKVGGDGHVSIRNNSGSVHVIVDVVGWVEGPA